MLTAVRAGNGERPLVGGHHLGVAQRQVSGEHGVEPGRLPVRISTGAAAASGGSCAGCVPGAIGRIPQGASLQEYIEGDPMAHLRGPGIEVWLEPQLPKDRFLWIEQ
jgi:hypothetical protein